MAASSDHLTTAAFPSHTMANVLTEMPDAPRSWQQSIDDYLTDHDIKYKQATTLKGGNSAYIWRLDDYQGSHRVHNRCVFKYGDSEIKGIPDFKVPEGRMHNEVRALNTSIVQEAGQKEDGVQVPRVLQATKDGFVMSWAGETDLRTAFIENPDLDAQALGSKLGNWLARLHVASIGNEEVETWTNEVIEMVIEKEIEFLRTGFKERGIDESIVKRAVPFLQKPGPVQTLTICDFGPMNTLLADKESSDPVARIVDWECTRYGDPAFDIRLWAAEAMVLEAKYGKERGLLSSFLTAYKEGAGSKIVNEEFVCRTAVVMGSMMF